MTHVFLQRPLPIIIKPTMSAFTCLIIIKAILIFQSHSTIIKSVSLTTSNTNDNNAQITIGSANNDCYVWDNTWEIEVDNRWNSQRGYHLEIDLDNSWGFHPSNPSTITLTVHSDTSIDKQPDLDLLVTFSVNKNQYLTHWFGLDNANPNSIYPGPCDISSSPTTLLASGDVKACVESNWCVETDRRDQKATNNNQNKYIMPQNQFTDDDIDHDDAFPMTIKLTNDPINNQLSTVISSPTWNGWTQGCRYGNVFATASGMQIYLALDDADEFLQIEEIYIEYSIDTESPTRAPTKNPSINPSISPTLIPTKNPSINPSSSPTIIPSQTPTNIPSGAFFVALHVLHFPCFPF